MEYKKFASTDKSASRLGFGSWQLGNSEFWFPMTDEEGIALVREAVQKGIIFFDTAPGYAGGKSEKILGKALVGIRDTVIINSKFGHRADGRTDFSSSSIEGAIKESLARLQTDYLDSLILHNPPKEILEGKTNHFEALEQMKKKGLIHAYGVSIDSLDEMILTLENTSSEVIEIMFNVFHQLPEEWLNKAEEKNVSLIAKVPLDSGWLSGRYDEFTVFTGIRDRWLFDDKKRRSDLVKKLKSITRDFNTIKYAFGFIYHFDAITTVIPGIHTIQHLSDNLKYADYRMPEELVQKCIELYDREIKNNPLPW